MRVVFMGSAEVSCTMLEALLSAPGIEVAGAVTQPDRPCGRHQREMPCPGKARAAQHRLAVITPAKVNTPEALAQMAAWAPDVIVVVAYGQILGRLLLDLPRLGCVNIHLSLLPRHRGAAPVQSAIAAGDAVSGVTAMLMDAGMDSGDILGQVAEPIGPDDTAGALYDRLAPLGARLLLRTLDDLAAGRAVRTPQEASRVTFAPKLHKEDGVIDWALPAAVIERRVRAFQPWPACRTRLPVRLRPAERAGWLKVWRVAVAPTAAVAGVAAAPGRVCDVGGEGPLVQTGDGALRLLDVQPEGSRRMTGRAFQNGHPLAIGETLG
jgi:methionyl-tRNA formyltransferase